MKKETFIEENVSSILSEEINISELLEDEDDECSASSDEVSNLVCSGNLVWPEEDGRSVSSDEVDLSPFSEEDARVIPIDKSNASVSSNELKEVTSISEYIRRYALTQPDLTYLKIKTESKDTVAETVNADAVIVRDASEDSSNSTKRLNESSWITRCCACFFESDDVPSGEQESISRTNSI